MAAEINNLSFENDSSLVPQVDLDHVNYPSLLRRYQAMLLDFILQFVLFAVVAIVFDALGITSTSLKIGAFIIIFVMYEPFLSARYCTLGQFLFKMRIRSQVDYVSHINIFQAIVRVILKYMLGWISFLTIHFNPERRALHDLFSGSVMIIKDTYQ